MTGRHNLGRSVLGLFTLCTLILAACGGPPPLTEPAASNVAHCIIDVEKMPAAWRPSSTQRTAFGNAPWTEEERQLALSSVKDGQKELETYFASHPEQVSALWDNAVEVFLDASYGAPPGSAFQRSALKHAGAKLRRLAAPYLSSKEAPTCAMWSELLTVVVYQQAIDPAGSDTQALVNKTNQAWRTCPNLEAAMGSNYVETLRDPKAGNSDIYDLVMWSITLTDAQLVPGLELDPGVSHLLPALWAYLASYPIPEPRDMTDGANDIRAYDGAYLATHIAYIPTGYGRHPLKVEMAPWLHEYLRANFYTVLELGELDLVGEFVDLFRQYGCSEANDRQLRDGSRHLMNLYRRSGKKWMSHRESYETVESNPYDLIHKPWTAIAGLRVRTPAPPAPGTYGAVALQGINEAQERLRASTANDSNRSD